MNLKHEIKKSNQRLAEASKSELDQLSDHARSMIEEGRQRGPGLNPIKYLQDNGWREYPDMFRKYARCFFKRYPTDKPDPQGAETGGMQVCVAVTEGSFGGLPACEIDLCGELPDGTWVKIHNWALPQEIEKVVELIPRLIRMWEAGNP